SLGVVSLSAWAIAAQLVFREDAARIVLIAATAELAIYSLLIAFVTDNFAVAIVNYLPATLFLIVAFYISYRATDAAPILLGLAGLTLTLLAAGVQQSRIALHPTYFNHNALYHLLQAIALFMVFRAAVFLSALVPGP